MVGLTRMSSFVDLSHSAFYGGFGWVARYALSASWSSFL